MQKKRDSTPVNQLELELNPLGARAQAPTCTPANNVIRIQFGSPNKTSLGGSAKDRALVERILQSAQRLKW